jgi:hypothetical protein
MSAGSFLPAPMIGALSGHMSRVCLQIRSHIGDASMVDSSEVTDYGGGSTLVRRHIHHRRFFDRLSHKYVLHGLSL